MSAGVSIFPIATGFTICPFFASRKMRPVV
jgi:hypothetical protein